MVLRIYPLLLHLVRGPLRRSRTQPMPPQEDLVLPPSGLHAAETLGMTQPGLKRPISRMSTEEDPSIITAAVAKVRNPPRGLDDAPLTVTAASPLPRVVVHLSLPLILENLS